MNEQLWHKLFAEKITKEYIGKLTGEEIPRIEGKVPEDLFIVGQLAPASTNMASYITSRVIINGIGVNFNIPVEDIPNAVLTVQPCGNWFYRVYPSYTEQCQATIRQYNKLFDRAYTTIGQFWSDTEVKEKIASVEGKKSNSYDIPLLQIYKRVSIEQECSALVFKVADLVDPENQMGIVDDLDPINQELFRQIQDIIAQKVLTDPHYYKYDVKSRITLGDLVTEEKWNAFLQREKKEVVNTVNWNMAVTGEFKVKNRILSIGLKLINKAEQVEGELLKKRHKDHVKISTIFNARLKVQLEGTKYIPIELSHFQDDYKYSKEQAALGFNCNIDFLELKETMDYIVTTNVPAFKQYRLKTNNDIPAHFIDLINSPVETLDTIHRGMLKALTDWRRTPDALRNR